MGRSLRGLLWLGTCQENKYPRCQSWAKHQRSGTKNHMSKMLPLPTKPTETHKSARPLFTPRPRPQLLQGNSTRWSGLSQTPLEKLKKSKINRPCGQEKLPFPCPFLAQRVEFFLVSRDIIYLVMRYCVHLRILGLPLFPQPLAYQHSLATKW